MKKKLAMRLCSMALCMVFTFSLFGVPKAKAVVAETAIGTAAVASYFQATGLTLTASAGSTGALVTAGIADIAGSYAMATGAASSGSAFLSSLAAGVSISPAGAIVLTAAAVVAIGALVAWYVSDNQLTEPETSVSVGSDLCYVINSQLYEIPTVSDFSAAMILDDSMRFYPNVDYILDNGYRFVLDAGDYDYIPTYETSYIYFYDNTGALIDSVRIYNPSKLANYFQMRYVESEDYIRFMYFNTSGSYQYFTSFSAPSFYPYLGSTSDLSITRAPEFTQPDTELEPESQKQMVIDAGFAAGTTIDTVAEQVPELIAAGTLAPTYEITSTEAGEGEGEETDNPDDATVVPGVTPWLQSIREKLIAIPEAITSGIADVFTPSQEAVDSLSAEVDEKLPIIPTLQNFGDDLVYKLEHPESCANGLGLTTVVNLGKGRGTYLGSTSQDLLDVSWYLEYKPLVDDIIVGFCWLGFLWNCYGALPRIIHGEGAIAGAITVLRKEDTGDDL